MSNLEDMRDFAEFVKTHDYKDTVGWKFMEMEERNRKFLEKQRKRRQRGADADASSNDTE